MADIAAIFHWSLADMIALSVPDLIAWHERAVATWNRMNGPAK